MITDEMVAAAYAAWREAVRPEVGFGNRDAMRAALEAAVGEMVLVPREPTEAMRNAWASAKPADAVVAEDGSVEAPYVSWFSAQYRALLAAANGEGE